MTSRRKKSLRNLAFLVAVSLFLTGFSLRIGFMNNYSTYNNVNFEEDSIFPTTVIMMKKRNNNNDSSSSSLYNHHNHHPRAEQILGTQQQQQQQQSTVFTTNETTTTSSSTTTSDYVSIEIDPNEDLTKYMERGANFLLATSGCGMATWVWNSGEHKFRDCKWRHEEQILEGHIRDIQDYDTVYIPIKYLYHFVVKKNKLDNITSKFVLLSGSFHIFQGSNRLGEGIVQRILNSTNVVAWFLHNPDTYVGRETAIKHSDKIHSFPYGLKTYRYSPKEPDPFKQFKIAFYRHLQLPQPKTRDIFVSYLSTFTNELRTDMPSGPKLPLQEYYDEIAKSKFLLSPNGDRPECYRHYEAIAFGTIPITEMDPTIYPHLDEYPILYNNTKWNNLTEQDVIQLMLEQHSNKLQQIDNGATGTTNNNGNKKKKVLKLRRHMIFEEYWMEYVEKIVGRPLRWWDKQSKQKAMLQNFTNTSYCGKNQQMIGWNRCIDNEKYFPPTNDTIVR